MQPYFILIVSFTRNVFAMESERVHGRTARNVPNYLTKAGGTEAKYFYGPDNGPMFWPTLYPQYCAGSMQSPINIDTKSTSLSDEPVFTYFQFNEIPNKATLKNDGNTAEIRFEYNSALPPLVTNGGLPGVYKVAQIHYHWGPDSVSGSDHQVNSISYPLEMHLVTQNAKYKDLAEAVDKPDGLAVLGFFFKASPSPDIGPGARKVYDALDQIKETGATIDLSFSLNDLFTNLARTTQNGFYRYKGSLTIPNCQESVTWSVFKELQEVPEYVLLKFRSLIGHHKLPINNNFRHPQPLNGRQVLEIRNKTPPEVLTKLITDAVTTFLQQLITILAVTFSGRTFNTMTSILLNVIKIIK